MAGSPGFPFGGGGFPGMQGMQGMPGGGMVPSLSGRGITFQFGRGRGTIQVVGGHPGGRESPGIAGIPGGGSRIDIAGILAALGIQQFGMGRGGGMGMPGLLGVRARPVVVPVMGGGGGGGGMGGLLGLPPPPAIPPPQAPGVGGGGAFPDLPAPPSLPGPQASPGAPAAPRSGPRPAPGPAQAPGPAPAAPMVPQPMGPPLPGEENRALLVNNDQPMEEWPAPNGTAPMGPNKQPFIDALNRIKSGGKLYWVDTDHPISYIIMPCSQHDAIGASLENRNTIIGTVWRGGFIMMNMSEMPDSVTADTTDTAYGHMVCKTSMYMMGWQPRRQNHPEAWSFIVRPCNEDGSCAVDHRGYMDRTLKQLKMNWVEVKYWEGGPRQYCSIMWKGRGDSPMVIFSNGWYLTLEEGLKQGPPARWPE